MALKHKSMLFVPAGIIFACAAFLLIAAPLRMPGNLVSRFAFKPFNASYSGEGTVVAYVAENDYAPSGASVRKEGPFRSELLKRGRTVLVYLPPGYSGTRKRPYPVLYALHGFASRPHSWVSYIIPVIEKAVESGRIPPMVVVMPDFSLSGNGIDDPATPYDDRGGCWYINSNRGRYRDHFFREIVPFVRKNFNVREDPGGTVMMGASMGGFAALYYSITEPGFAHTVVGIYPAADLRYGIAGDKLAEYDAGKYAPLDYDDMDRIVNASNLGGIAGITERWIYAPVFDSDAAPGPVWKEDLPVWRRLEAVSPADILRKGGADLSGTSYYLLAGDRDDFNIDSQVKVIIPLLKKSGAKVYPENWIIPGGRHLFESIMPKMDEAVAWIGSKLSRTDSHEL